MIIPFRTLYGCMLDFSDALPLIPDIVIPRPIIPNYKVLPVVLGLSDSAIILPFPLSNYTQIF